jgi:hypothetical protein
MFGIYVIDSPGFPGHHRPPGAICQVRAMARSDAEEVSTVLSAYVRRGSSGLTTSLSASFDGSSYLRAARPTSGLAVRQ